MLFSCQIKPSYSDPYIPLTIVRMIPHRKQKTVEFLTGITLLQTNQIAIKEIEKKQEVKSNSKTIVFKSNNTLISVLILIQSKKPILKSFTQTQLVRLGFVDDGKSIDKLSHESYITPSAFISTYIASNPQYNPFFLDDPKYIASKTKTVIALPCFIASIISYSRPLDLKKELNISFRESHITVDPALTLSQIRNMKAKLLRICKLQDIDYSSLAACYVYFEKLILKSSVTKQNKRLIGGICLFLACKINEPRDKKYHGLLEAIEDVLEVPPAQIFQNEFSVYADLEFTLFLPGWQIIPHLERIASNEGITIRDYVGGMSFFGE